MLFENDPDIQNRYQVQEEIGRGGMGCVYKVFDRELKRIVALKVTLTDEFLDRQRFEREAKVLASLSNPNIIRVLDYGTLSDGQQYLVMPFIAGQTLDSWILDQKNRIRASVKVIKELAHALSYLHSKSVIHRDLKPQNVLIDEAGTPILLDFGLARPEGVTLEHLTVSGVILGTYSYMPPEQANGEKADERADVYGLGAILYDCLCGRAPSRTDRGQYAMLIDILENMPPAPVTLNKDVPLRLSDFCMRTLAKLPQQRPQSAKDFADELSRACSTSHSARPLKKLAFPLSIVVILLGMVLAWSLMDQPSVEKDGDRPLVIQCEVPGLKVFQGEVYLGTTDTNGELKIEEWDQKRELQFARKNGDRCSISLPIVESQAKAHALQLYGHSNLRTPIDARVDIRDSKGRIATSKAGRVLQNQATPISADLLFGQYQATLTFRSPMNGKRRSWTTTLLVKPKEIKTLRVPLGFQSKLPAVTWSHPILMDIDQDGLSDFIFVGDSPRQADGGQIFAISGFNGQLLWTLENNSCVWTCPLIKKTGNQSHIVFADTDKQGPRTVWFNPRSGRELGYLRTETTPQSQWHVGLLPFGLVELPGRETGVALVGHSSVSIVGEKQSLYATFQLKKKIKVHFRDAPRPTIVDLDRDGRRNDLLVPFCTVARPTMRESSILEVRAYRDIERKQDTEAFQAFMFSASRQTEYSFFEHSGLLVFHSAKPDAETTHRLKFVDPKSFKELASFEKPGPQVCFAESVERRQIYVLSYFQRSEFSPAAQIWVYNSRGELRKSLLAPKGSERLVLVNTELGERLLFLAGPSGPYNPKNRELVMLDPSQGFQELWRSGPIEQQQLFTADLDRDGQSEVAVLSYRNFVVEKLPAR